MLEQADQSGRIDPDDFDEQTIIDLFGKAGANAYYRCDNRKWRPACR